MTAGRGWLIGSCGGDFCNRGVFGVEGVPAVEGEGTVHANEKLNDPVLKNTTLFHAGKLSRRISLQRDTPEASG